MALSLGVHIGQQAMPMADLRALWRRLDGAEVDWISVWDHLYEAPPAGGWPGLLVVTGAGWLLYQAARDSSRK